MDEDDWGDRLKREFKARREATKFERKANLLRELLAPIKQRGLQLLVDVTNSQQLGKMLMVDSSLVDYIEEVEVEAQRMLKENEPKLTKALFRTYEETGERLSYELVYFEKRKRLNAFAIMSLLRPEDNDYREALIQAIWSICTEDTWCLPAHYDEAHGLLGNIDLFAAETGFALAELDALLGDCLPTAIRERIATETERRLFYPFLEDRSYHWEQLENNWSAVCAGSIGAAALYLIEDTERLSLLLERVLGAMDYFLAGYGADGACVEGYSYWQYGFGYYVYFFSLLKKATSDNIDGFASDKVREIALFQQRCFSGRDTTINFSDALPRSGIFMGLTWRLFDEYAEMALPSGLLRAPYIADHCGRFAPAIRNLLWTAGRGQEQSVRDEMVVEAGRSEEHSVARETLVGSGIKLEKTAWPAISHYMADAGWFISRTVIDDSATYTFAAKGGHNAEPHNHNDCGHFILHVNGDAYLADLGSGMYSKSYFGPERYSFWCNGSQGHSVPLVSGKRQVAGAESQAKVTNVSISSAEDRFELELSAAYPESEGLHRLERNFRWNKEGLPRLTLHDRAVFEKSCSTNPREGAEVSQNREVDEEQGAGLTERFVTLLEPKLEDGGRVTLTGSHRMIIGYDVTNWTPVITSRSDIDHFGKARHWYTIDFVRLKRSYEDTIEATFYFEFN